MTITKLRMRVPDLRVQADAVQIKQILLNAPGIDRIIADFEAGILEVTTAAQDGGADTIRMLSGGGYPPSEVDRIDDGNRPA
jgi:hypothetical protein